LATEFLREGFLEGDGDSAEITLCAREGPLDPKEDAEPQEGLR
jgi:hypothetical protein